MGDFVTSFVIFGVLWALLRLGREAWAKNQLPRWMTPVGGVVAWGAVLSLAGPVIAIARLFLRVMERPDVAAGYEFGGIAILGSLVVKVLIDHAEILDYDRVQPFFFASLKFQPYGQKRDNIFAELERHEIRTLYKEQTGKDLILENQEKKIPSLTPEQARKLLEESRKVNPRSVHLKTEVDQLLQGKETDINEAFVINRMKVDRHRLYNEISDLKIDPASKTLRFKIRFPELSPGVELTAEKLFRIKQDFYDVLQFLNMEFWMKPYVPFVETFDVTCHRVELDSFNMPEPIPFMRVEIPTAELRQRENSIFIATELNKIAKVTMEGKKYDN